MVQVKRKQKPVLSKTKEVVDEQEVAVPLRESNHRHFKQLSQIEFYHLHDIPRFIQLAKKQADKKAYESAIRLQNHYWSDAFRRSVAAEYTKKGTEGYDPNEAGYKFGFYLGLLIVNKTARAKMTAQFKHEDIPSSQDQGNFLKALGSEERKGREPFTPETAAMTKIGLIDQTYWQMKRNPKDVKALKATYDKGCSALYELAVSDGISRQVVDNSTQAIVQEMVKVNPSMKQEFAGLLTKQLKPIINTQKDKMITYDGYYLERDNQGKFKDKLDGLDVRIPLTKDNYEMKLAGIIAKNANTLVKTKNPAELKQYLDTYKLDTEDLATEAKFDGVYNKKKFNQAVEQMPITVMAGSLKQAAEAALGEDKGTLAYCKASRFVEKSLLANTNSLDYRRRAYNFAQDNMQDVGDLAKSVGLIESLSKISQVAMSASSITPAATRQMLADMRKHYEKELGLDKAVEVDTTSINADWDQQLVKNRAKDLRPAVDEQQVDPLNDGLDAKALEKANKAGQMALNVVQSRGHGSKNQAPQKGLDLLSKMAQEYGLAGISLVLDQYRTKPINQSQYYKIPLATQVSVAKDLANIKKSDSHHMLSIGLKAYEQSIAKSDSSYAQYLANRDKLSRQKQLEVCMNEDFGNKKNKQNDREEESKMNTKNKTKFKDAKDAKTIELKSVWNLLQDRKDIEIDPVIAANRQFKPAADTKATDLDL